MKNSFISLAIVMLFFFSGCSISSKSPSKEEIGTSQSEEFAKFLVENERVAINFIEYKKYSFPISNIGSDNFGYLSVIDGEDISIKGISLSEGYAILVDTYFSNLKMVNLSNGIVKTSSSIGNKVVTETGVWLGEAVFFNDSIFVCGLDSIFVFDQSPKKIRSIKVNRGAKKVWSKNIDTLCVYVDHEQFKNEEVEVDLLCISSDGNDSKITKVFNSDIFATTYREKRTGGLTYRVFSDSSGHFLETTSKVYRLQFGIPEIPQYNAVNIAITPNEIAYFTISPDTLTLHYYVYP